MSRCQCTTNVWRWVNSYIQPVCVFAQFADVSRYFPPFHSICHHRMVFVTCVVPFRVFHTHKSDRLVFVCFIYRLEWNLLSQTWMFTWLLLQLIILLHFTFKPFTFLSLDKQLRQMYCTCITIFTYKNIEHMGSNCVYQTPYFVVSR